MEYDNDSLKTSNIQLLNQLQSGLSELRTMVSKYPQKLHDDPPSTSTTEERTVPRRRSTRVTSTPKHSKQEQRATTTTTTTTPLAEKVHSLLISDTGNRKPRKRSTSSIVTSPAKSPKTPQTKKANRSPKSILRSSKRTKTPLRSSAGNLKNVKKTPLSKSKIKSKPKYTLDTKNSAKKTPRKVCFSPTVSSDPRSRKAARNANADTSVQGGLDSSKRLDTSMVGYDWIAAMVDNDVSINDRPDEFFQDLDAFRKENWNECKSIKSRVASDGSVCETSTVQLSPTIKHQEKENFPLCCTGNGAYMIDNRLNLLPIHGPYSACPTCKSKPQSQTDVDGYVRVSIPRSTIKSPYKLRPHRRRSFDPSDSVALSMHCLAGWQAAKPSCIRGPTAIDLASHAAKPGLKSVKALKNAGSKRR